MDYTLQYYDLVLVAIASSLGAGVLVGVATPIAPEVSIAALGLVAIGFIGHALFVNGPVDEVEDLTEEVEPEEIPTVLSPVDAAD